MFFYETGTIKPGVIFTKSSKQVSLEEVLNLENKFPKRHRIYEYRSNSDFAGCSFELLECEKYPNKQKMHYKIIVYAPDKETASYISGDCLGCYCLQGF